MDPSVKKAAWAIMSVFRDKGARSGDFVNFSDFGKALRWEAGYIKHENQRDGLRYLLDHGYVVETKVGLELTGKGAKFVENM